MGMNKMRYSFFQFCDFSYRRILFTFRPALSLLQGSHKKTMFISLFIALYAISVNIGTLICVGHGQVSGEEDVKWRERGEVHGDSWGKIRGDGWGDKQLCQGSYSIFIPSFLTYGKNVVMLIANIHITFWYVNLHLQYI